MAQTTTLDAPRQRAQPRIRFDRNELSGAFGDIGTDLPLIVGMILAAKLDPASVLTMFGLMQLLTGLTYGLPMPAQPLKAMAVLVISGKATASVLYGGGLAIGITMLVLTVTGLMDWLAVAVPKSVVRGIQCGLGLQLAILALTQYVPAEGGRGYVLAAIAFVVTLLLLGNRVFPPAPLLIVLGVAYAFAFKLNAGVLAHSLALQLPRIHTPRAGDILVGFIVLALPQLPLSLGNSILATRQIAEDLFPQRRVGIRKISYTYSLMNLINPFFGGVPTCHGSGGMAGHYAFGGRTGGSIVIYGSIYLALGLFLSHGFQTAIELFPRPVLGVILAFEGLVLIRLIRDMASSVADFTVVVLVALMCVGLPYGYVIGLVVGTIAAHFLKGRLQGLSK
ncbi:MAG TPA: putative sulfate/molybdate transporter [Rugosimonospora sp.]|nr:putative sulfate/molybdate transporter [Rugosimonospora sp.]